MWLAPEAIATWEAVGVGKHSGQLQYSDLAIEVALTLRLIFHLPLRQTEGFLTSIFRMLRLDLFAPDHTTLSRRGQHLDLALRRVPTGEGLHLIVDSTGLSIVGEGEWAAAKHGGQGTRGWKKLHLGVDRTGVILAQALTDPNVADATTAKDLRRSRCAVVGKNLIQPWCGRPGRLGGVLGMPVVAVTAVASSVIYGLRKEVRAAARLGQYELKRKLGEGGMGVVYEATHVLLRRPTAVKLLPVDKVRRQSPDLSWRSARPAAWSIPTTCPSTTTDTRPTVSSTTPWSTSTGSTWSGLFATTVRSATREPGTPGTGSWTSMPFRTMRRRPDRSVTSMSPPGSQAIAQGICSPSTTVTTR